MRRQIILLLLWISIGPARADEGMWLYNAPPETILKERYGFTPTPEWSAHLQKASVRFNNGGSGSFVSPDGLVMTNHHVASDAIAKLSSAEHDYTRDGFYARTREQELPCHDLELNVLMEIEDVTDRIRGAVKPEMSAAEAEKARRAAMNTLEQESFEKTGLRSDVITLFRGGLYHLYRYKRYTDVRLVFAPELSIAFFGGDTDNFEYPRYCLDVSFVRVYQDGKPIRPPGYLRWSPAGVKEGDLVFVSGHPGRTDRLNTMSHLEFLRDVRIPLALNMLRRWEVLLTTWSERDAENARRARDDLFGVQNSRKAYTGMLAGLQDPRMVQVKRDYEQALRAEVTRDPQLAARFGDAWDRVAAAVEVMDRIYDRHTLLEGGRAFHSQTFGLARTLVRLAEEKAKPNAQRLREYGESALPSLEQELFSEAPLYEDLETLKLADSLGMLVEKLGVGDPLVQRVLAGKAPRDRAVELIYGSTLRDVKVRRQLAEGGKAAILASSDPMIQLALQIDPEARRLRKIMEQEVAEPMEQAYGRIAQALLASRGQTVYPDATFTLRLAFGTVSGYREDGRTVPWSTSVGGLYERAAAHDYKPPFKPPESWMKARERLNLETPFDFVSTVDIIGGNSGSPVVDRSGDVVGLIFDGNLESLVLDFQYTDETARALSVDTRAILEALEKVYEAQSLAQELRATPGGR
ncbi:MAG: S46 family peptidase [Armatimonadetes bacterium]|nr:S46 family peptidase [Armatimonadota bacterium]